MHDYENWLFEFEVGKAKEKHALLVDLLERFALSDWPHVVSFVSQIEDCGRLHRPFWFGDVGLRPKYCNHPLCPKCRRRIANKSKRNGMSRLLKAAGGSMKPSDVSAVSINGLPLTDIEDPRATRDRMARAIRDAVRDHGLDIRGIGRFEITRMQDRSLRLDIHCEIHHPGMHRADVLNLLKDVFPGNRAVQVKAHDVDEQAASDEELEMSIERFLDYSVKACISGEKANNETVEDVFQIITAYQQIRSVGCKGLNFEIGLRKRKTKTPDISLTSVGSEQIQELRERLDVTCSVNVITRTLYQLSNNDNHTSFSSCNTCTYKVLVSPCSTQLQDRYFSKLKASKCRLRLRCLLSASPDLQILTHHTGNPARAPPSLSYICEGLFSLGIGCLGPS